MAETASYGTPEDYAADIAAVEARRAQGQRTAPAITIAGVPEGPPSGVQWQDVPKAVATAPAIQWQDMPRGTPDTPRAAPAVGDTIQWQDVAPARAGAPQGIAWQDVAPAKPEPEDPRNIWEKYLGATPESNLATKGLIGTVAGMPKAFGEWWQQTRQTSEDAAAEREAIAPGSAMKRALTADEVKAYLGQITDEHSATRQHADLMAGGFAGAGIPMRGGIPTTNVPIGRAPGFPNAPTSNVGTVLTQKLTDAIAKPAADTIEKIFSPTTVGPFAREAEGLIREKVGQRAQQTEQARAQMDEFQQLVNSKTPQEQNAFVAHVEDPKGPSVDPSLAPVADTLKKIYDERRQALEAMPSTAKAAFVEDYYPHMWKDRARAVQGLGEVGRGQGGGSALKGRSIPTLQDGLARGLEPLYQNPLEATLAYVTNMDRFIAHNQIFDTAKASGTIKTYPVGKQPQGWVELKGRLAKQANGSIAYAPEDFARVYNNFISRGWHDVGPMAGKVYDKVRAASNAITMAELSFSGFHATTMVNEGMVSELSKAVGMGLRGDLKGALKQTKNALSPVDREQARLAREAVQRVLRGDKAGGAMKLGKSAIPAGARKLIDKGLEFEQQYLNLANFGPEMAKAVELGARANMRAVPSRSHEYRGSAQGSFWEAWRKGNLGAEMKESGKKLAQGNAMEGARLVGRLMDTVAAPLFDKMIPRMKNGAFYSEISDWLKAHPLATDAEQAAAARKIWDSIDNRFGEMQYDNLFWNQMLKQTAQVSLRAAGWDIGTIAEVGGGAVDVLRGAKSGAAGLKDLSPRAKYVIALPVVAVLLNQTMSYLKTGAAAPDPFVYPTGGENPDGTPEKAIVPGYMKDVIGYTQHPLDTAKHKIATAPRTAWELLTNRDYRDMPIAEMSEWAEANGAPPWWAAYIAHIAKTAVPITVKSMEQKEGSNISTPERLLGMTPAPKHLQDPEGTARIQDRAAMRRDKALEKSNRRLDQQYGR